MRADGNFAIRPFGAALSIAKLQAMVVAGLLLPTDTMRLTGLDPSSSEFYERAREQLRRIVQRLA